LGCPLADLTALRGLRFTGEAWAVPEGRVVLAGEPLLEVTAALPQAQLVETFLLNQVVHQIALTSKRRSRRLVSNPETPCPPHAPLVTCVGRCETFGTAVS
jgi:nicotinic acid phosphoribosyltransferase